MLNAKLHPQLQIFEEEIEPQKRYEALKAWYSDVRESVDSSAPPTTADAYRIELFNRRFAPPRKKSALFGSRKDIRKSPVSTSHDEISGNASFRPDVLPAPAAPGEADLYLRNILTMLTIYRNGGLFFKHSKKEVLAMLQEIQLDERPLQDKNFEDILYREIRNAFRRYFSTCQSSAYGKKLLGTVDASEEEKEILRCTETWIASYGMASHLGLTSQMAIWCRAANDEYCASVQGVSSLEDAYIAYGGKIRRSGPRRG